MIIRALKPTRMALTDEQREEFDTYIRRYKTPMEETFKYAYNTYIRGYRAADRIIFNTYGDEQKALIKEFYATATTLERKQELREVMFEGSKLVAGYESRTADARKAMRIASPILDFYLYVFGYITKPATPQAESMVSKWESDRSSILINPE